MGTAPVPTELSHWHDSSYSKPSNYQEVVRWAGGQSREESIRPGGRDRSPPSAAILRYTRPQWGQGTGPGTDSAIKEEEETSGFNTEQIESKYTRPMEDTEVMGVGRCGGLGCQCGEEEDDRAKVTKVKRRTIQREWTVAPGNMEDSGKMKLKLTRKTKAKGKEGHRPDLLEGDQT